ncbi:MAG: hypothetical protein QOE63_1413, partial [Acidimicrobiaceae bacterium]
MLKVIVQERDGHALVAVDGFADDSLVHAVAGQLADVLVAPTIVLDLAGAVITRPHAVRELAVRLAAGRAPWQVRIVCPRLTARRALRDALGGAEVAVVATVADA